MPTVKVGDLDIGYETHGEGPALLFIMGFTAARHHWLAFHRRFADRFRVIAFDNRGVGETTATTGAYTTAQMAQDALGLLDALDVPTAHVLGVSMGGMIAQELALAAPSRVERLVLGCTHFGGPRTVLPGADVLAAFGRVGRQSAEATIRELLAFNLTPEFVRANAEVFEGLVRHGLGARMNPFAYAGQVAAIATHDVEARLPTLASTTLVIGGDRDQLIPPKNFEALASRLPHAELVMLRDVAHMFWAEAPDAAETAIRAHLG